MTLDEAICRAEEVADKKEQEKQKWERWLETYKDSDYRALNEKMSCEVCAKKHRQLAEWLKDYKRLLNQQPSEDCVSRQEVIKYLNTNMEWYDENGNIADSDEKLNAIADLINGVPPVTPTQSWIPVSERLPRQEVEVLTCNEHGFIEIQSLEDGYWENQHGDCTDLEDSDIGAWQPLPQPYKEKRGNENGSN